LAYSGELFKSTVQKSAMTLGDQAIDKKLNLKPQSIDCRQRARGGDFTQFALKASDPQSSAQSSLDDARLL